MADDQPKPDLLAGVALDAVPESGLLAGTIGTHDAVLVRDGGTFRAVGAKCTHLGAPMAKGLLVGGELRCPWHHACFDIASGRAAKAPAFDPLPVWPVAIEEGRARVTQAEPLAAPRRAIALAEGPFVIVGGGAAGYAAAVALKEGAPRARVVVLSDEDHAPYDRTILTKDYLDGKFGDDRLPISKVDLAGLGVELRLSTAVSRIDRGRHEVVIEGGEALPYAKLLIATGAAPKRPDLPGADADHVRVLRSLADCRAVLARIGAAKTVVLLGASFIGLETAASLRSRGLAVTVVSPEEAPTAKVFGDAVSEAVMEAHRGKGVEFRLGREATAIGARHVTLDDGSRLPADLVVLGIGVEPRTGLAEAAGLTVADGIVVDANLRTSDPDVYAAGDVARWPDPHTGRDIRVEHWVVAQRQGQAAAANMLGQPTPFAEVPFFWSKHFDLSLRYVGHAGEGDRPAVDGSPAKRDAAVTFSRDGRVEAVATIGRDLESLEREAAMERAAAAG